MCPSFAFAFALLLCGADETPFPLRSDAPPKEWKADEINAGLPLHWEKGAAHVLAWEVTEDDGDEGHSQATQILVVKKFDQPTEKDGYRWVLTRLYYDPKDKERPWKAPFYPPPPVLPGEKLPPLTDAQVFSWEFYKEPPSDKQVEAFLRDTCWKPHLGPQRAWTISDGKAVTINYTTKLTGGGIDPGLWKSLFARDVPTHLFPELKVGPEDKK